MEHIPKENLNEISNTSKEVDTIFYFVCPENLMLKKEAMEEVAYSFAEKLDFKLYGMRSGPDVQDAKCLLNELVALSPEKFEIVYVSKESDEASVLSHAQKLEFMAQLKDAHVNTGLIAKSFVDNSDSSYYPVYNE